MINYDFFSKDFFEKGIKNPFENLIVIYGPFQLLNAIEAINEFKLKNILLIVMTNKIEKSNLQVENYINKYKIMFSHVERIKFSSSSKKYIEYLKFLNPLKIHKFKYILVGTLGKAVKLLLTKLDYEQLILFDDGLETLNTAEVLHSKPKLLRYQYFYLGLNHYFKKDIILFTILKHQNKEIKSIKNKMFYLDSKSKQVIDKNKIAFIGQDFVRTGYLKKEDYYNVLKSISKRHSENIIYYYPHRGETDIELDEIAKQFSNFCIKKIDTTFEIYLIEEEYLPYKIISCWSTVLIIMNSLYNNISLESIFIDSKKLIKNQNNILETYLYFQKESIDILDVEGNKVIDVQ